MDGRNASYAAPGQNGGTISITVSRSHILYNIHVQGTHGGIPFVHDVPPSHFVNLSACGGKGGDGGHGVGGQNGQDGANGSHATRYSAGTVSIQICSSVFWTWYILLDANSRCFRMDMPERMVAAWLAWPRRKRRTRRE